MSVHLQRLVGRPQYRAYLLGILTACEHVCGPGCDQPTIAAELLKNTNEASDLLKALAAHEELKIPEEVYPPNNTNEGQR